MLGVGHYLDKPPILDMALDRATNRAHEAVCFYALRLRAVSGSIVRRVNIAHTTTVRDHRLPVKHISSDRQIMSVLAEHGGDTADVESVIT
jgi:hypothetical protein